ncbi:MAG: phosphoesterase [Acidobacteriaceae bacterium]|nr:phosphoesterase [Acidobacteriaceae bacterium]MBV9780575.1 phosphoesterase [Acidobacteriaceae bacterium]
MKLRVLYHDHCFDGAASAAFVTRFLQTKFYPGADPWYTGLAHRADQLFEDSLFDGDVNVIVDFKYSPHPNVTWWFDHHQSAFLTPEDAEHFRHETSGRKLLDPSYRSCTKFISTVVREQYGFEAPDLEELITWADIIDGALFESAQAAVEMNAPAMKLTLVIEGSKGSKLVEKIIRDMQRRPLADIITEPEVRANYDKLYQAHLRTIDVIRGSGSCDRGVIYFDLVDSGIEGYNKFIPYYLFPDSAYTVSVSTSSFRTKVSVGSNPWVREPLRHNLATICERYGGGGHPKVGAISFPIGAVGEARRAAAEIREELKN